MHQNEIVSQHKNQQNFTKVKTIPSQLEPDHPHQGLGT